MSVTREAIIYIPQDFIAPAWNPHCPKWVNLIPDPHIQGFSDERGAEKLIETMRESWAEHPELTPRPLGYRIVSHHTVTTDTVIREEKAGE